MNDRKRVVVITGGSMGIGRAIAMRFAEERPLIQIIHYDRDDSASASTLQMLSRKGVEAESHRVDVSIYQDVERLFANILSKYGQIHVLVNNAGIIRDALFMRMTEDDWDTVIRVNLKSVFNCTHAVLRDMVKKREGRIVSISSVVGQMGNPGQANYAASKAGIMGFTKTIAREVAGRGITVNAVAPGFINTEMTKPIPEKVRKAFLGQIPMGMMGEPEDVAETVYWLCSDAARYITGQVIHVNGGLLM
ncbi:MAG: 3-oxoacyl-[acyl-carrier-protein] reductase [Deltaproteobacteria bacterium]|nr:3-oxoacyl-[acyl-carrier-protein] reductase [Deltaproteobacteria bacterium]MBW2135943.1 3-oxoacyl-[acyl-carrier-protein] reductase [Deltaproteobacteria bacterium]